MKNKNTLIVFYPYRFTLNHFTRYEIEFLRKYCDVLIFEFGELLNKDFYKSQMKHEEIPCSIVKVNGLPHLYQLLNKIEGNIVILDDIPRDSFKSLLINFLIKIKKIQTFIGIDNTNTLYNSVNSKYSFSSFKNLRKSIMYRIYTLFFKVDDYRMVRGEGLLEKKLKTKDFYTHSWEYSNGLSYEGKIQIDFKYAVLLDGAGPKFNSDNALLNDKYFLTSDKWYPSLVRFMEDLESEHGVKFLIAAHPSSNFGKRDKVFGGREIYHGMSQQLVKGCEFIVTRASTSTRFAVIYNKPAIFIYSNQIPKTINSYNDSLNWKESIGGSLINIDQYPHKEIKILNVDSVKYENYMKEISSSQNLNRPNYQIILHNIFEYDFSLFVNKD